MSVGSKSWEGESSIKRMKIPKAFKSTPETEYENRMSLGEPCLLPRACTGKQEASQGQRWVSLCAGDIGFMRAVLGTFCVISIGFIPNILLEAQSIQKMSRALGIRLPYTCAKKKGKGKFGGLQETPISLHPGKTGALDQEIPICPQDSKSNWGSVDSMISRPSFNGSWQQARERESWAGNPA